MCKCPVTGLPRCVLGLIYIFIGVAALAAAFIAEYGFGMVPCELCIYQRVPYVFIILFGASVAYFLRRGRVSHAVWGLRGILLALLIGAGIGIYQTGGERDWWELSQGCSADAFAEALKSGGDIAAALKAQSAVPCDRVSFSIMGLSFASLNAIFSLILAVLTVTVCLHIRKCNNK